MWGAQEDDTANSVVCRRRFTINDGSYSQQNHQREATGLDRILQLSDLIIIVHGASGDEVMSATQILDYPKMHTGYNCKLRVEFQYRVRVSRSAVHSSHFFIAVLVLVVRIGEDSQLSAPRSAITVLLELVSEGVNSSQVCRQKPVVPGLADSRHGKVLGRLGSPATLTDPKR